MHNFQRGGPCLNFAYFSMQFYNPGDHVVMAPPKYAPVKAAILKGVNGSTQGELNFCEGEPV